MYDLNYTISESLRVHTMTNDTEYDGDITMRTLADILVIYVLYVATRASQ